MLRICSRMREVANRPAASTASGSEGSSGPSYLCGQLGHVFALVTVICDGLAAAAGEQARSECADLAAGVVHVVLAIHVPARTRHHPGEGVPVRTPPAVADVERAGRVGRDELDLNPLAVPEIGARVVLLPFGDDLDEGVVEPARRESQVDEARARNLHVDQVGRGILADRAGEVGCKLARIGGPDSCR